MVARLPQLRTKKGGIKVAMDAVGLVREVKSSEMVGEHLCDRKAELVITNFEGSTRFAIIEGHYKNVSMKKDALGEGGQVSNFVGMKLSVGKKAEKLKDKDVSYSAYFYLIKSQLTEISICSLDNRTLHPSMRLQLAYLQKLYQLPRTFTTITNMCKRH